MTGISIDVELTKTLIAQSILDAIGPEARDSMIKEAVEKIITPPKDTYGRVGQSLVQEAFENATRTLAYSVVREYVEQPEVKQQIQQVLAEYMRDLLSNADSYRDLVGAGISHWLKNRSEHNDGSLS